MKPLISLFPICLLCTIAAALDLVTPTPQPKRQARIQALVANGNSGPAWANNTFAWSMWYSPSSFTLEKSEDLINWRVIITNTNAPALSKIVFDLNATNRSAFYRVRERLAGANETSQILLWEPSPAPTVNGYYVYWRTNGEQYSVTNRLPITTTSNGFDLDMLDLPPGDYCAQSTATEPSRESEPTEEVEWEQ